MIPETKPVSAGLHLVSTPIGTARDITLRALDVLAGADIVAAEDTRTARRLMEIHGVAVKGRRFVAYHDHSAPSVRDDLVSRMSEGQSVAYVSEAGTPLVADPGYALARSAIAAEVPVHAAPGASAVLAALAVAGLPTDRFAFIGFLSSQATQRDREITELRDLPMTLVIYESPHRVAATVARMAEILGPDRPAAICRELTKKFEEVIRGPIGTLATQLAEGQTRGEYVIVLGKGETEVTGEDDLRAALKDALRTMRVKDAANMVAGAMGVPRRDVYQMALELSKKD
ncbi:16S rRNA (cytidine(1402)-2'-O)-methyltransferase [Ponticoccus sp. SC2-23]|uniref:16S rRNA (cytidine(1402)-2'-O)-methyltransferase n=1 Tax=Alexandriicola marinus TaxID=2081710 RepID=UPI000FDAB9CD|nr:16S rRNA (cytidine(1402)-2'-O)-methyltransferase [Alexandriicola marinus]MBM1220139.1 16S rRNA (cytidine(1402)-2'-O)-methyltransferase [Ponticoccus sp. SC6-9]MBM1224825.1 16S rRNA (cytidine(1402)-2'-O)-methyltransferase [Ponticoccus sp. SC6-15]MBM1228339.1 16S rRNA (cytidine(1402)-2'-O)-methyltransferase [Ponticoccus sp. SC6-38]MBM1234024.1 16S rRNA (cytidine(1402)-2'-O)-methyltransferase [Ponticoccus sp. SC6-45]MBM1238840.1 16S rRNA (cytidine(1402)-2'-O)-methyltransferase [Ponticoccus sp. 